MPGNLILISQRREDFAFAEQVATRLKLTLKQCVNRESAAQKLTEDPGAIVLWNADTNSTVESVVDIVGKYANPKRLFAITENNLDMYPHLFKMHWFRNQLWRHFDGPGKNLLPIVMASSLSEKIVGVELFFPKGANQHKIQITRSAHRKAAIEAIHKTLGKLGMQDRLSAVVAQGADELIMNAVFHAPRKADGTVKHIDPNKDSDFLLEAKEQVELDLIEGEETMGIAVTDQFGSFEGHMFMNTLRPILEKKTKVSVAFTGLGFHKVISSGLSLMLCSTPGQKTKAILFFPKTTSYKAFKSGFRFFCNYAD